MQESIIILHVVALGLGQALSFWGGEGVGGEGWRGGHVSVRGMTEFSVT